MARRKRDYYAVLGVSRDATDGELKRAFRELARKHHPDVSPDNNGEVFREINEAYAVLSDKESRARYDRWGHPDDTTGLSVVVEAAQDIINDVFRRRKTRQRGADLRYTLELSFEEAAFGCSKTIEIPAGGGVEKMRAFTVMIAAGVLDGTVKTFKGEGEPGKGGAAAGDLHVSLRVAEHPLFRRDGLDVRSEHTISFPQAALGAVVEIATLDGPIKMRIPGGTQPGRVFRIRGRGIPQASGKTSPRGDHLVHMLVEVPTELTPRQRELIEELAQSVGESRPGSPQKRRLLDRVRSLLDE
ncbi:MAG TPA: DnaJ C-terminal domain-containing protein [Kofleriaceae bacterium]|jgi:molecular chaperone DnaJ|nr:DnaJ C-terminal domain-containing protein [Kofleriaceae bacterium]